MPQSSRDQQTRAAVDQETLDKGSLSRPPSRFSKWIKRLVLIAITCTAMIAGVAGLLLYLVTHEPGFYRALLDDDLERQQENGSQMETKILDLRNSVLSELDWSASFTQDQINGWLACDLPKKLPDMTPPDVSEPRAMLEEEAITLSFRYRTRAFTGVVAIKADVFLTGVVNQIGIRIISIHCGRLPIPIASMSEQISKKATQAGFAIEWDQEQGDSVALLDLPESLVKPNDGGSYIALESLQVLDGKIQISGKTHPPDF